MNGRSMLWRGVAAVAVATCLASAGQAQANALIAVVAKKIVTGAGPDVENAALLIEGGRIQGIVAAGQIPPSAVVVDRSDACLAPGYVEAYSSAGSLFDLEEDYATIDQFARVADALNLEHRDFDLLAESGVTTAVIVPSHRNIVAGSCAVVKTAGAAERLILADGPLKMALSMDTLTTKRMPTSFIGAADTLRSALTAAKGADAESTPLGKLVRKQRGGILWAQTERELRAALALRQALDLDFSILGAADARETLALMKDIGLRVALAPLAFADSRRTLTQPRALEAAGVKVAFYADSPRRSADGLRVSAALAARNGLSRAAAIAAVTLTPAELAGAGMRVGSLAAGKDADFVVLSGDPLDLSSRLQETWIAGQRVKKAPAVPASTEVKK